ncbi:hypothetical protein [uncultured Methylobacterium sp.]|uniref:hypothetical protein n=1 Tax=uncultured Methylobacterium sp. TaxID=157278 RepID=UPI0026136E5A|nr:hypothetical protein [uncultured Methylobacterium sp.]
MQAADGASGRGFPASIRAIMAAIRRLADDQGGALVTSGQDNAYTVATETGVAALRAGLSLAVRFDRSNTDVATLNVDGLGPRPIRDADGQPLLPGQIKADRIGLLIYDATRGVWCVDVSAGINSPAFVGAPTAPTPADTAVDQQIPTAAFIKRQLEYIPLQRHGVVGNGAASDMDRMNTALAEMSETRKRLIPEASRDYNFGAQLRLPARTFLDIPRSTTFHFYATDAFTSTTRPSTPGSANGHCVYAEEANDVTINGLRLIFHPKQNSYVHGLTLRGGSHHRVNDYEGAGFCSGSVLKIDSVTDIVIVDPYVHDCTLDMPNGTSSDGQLSGLDLDNDRILIAGGAARLTTGHLVRGRFERLLATAQTIATGPGRQTDGLTLISNQISPTGGGFTITGTWIEEVYEGIDCALAAFMRVRDVQMRNIGVTGIKLIHGSHDCVFERIIIDGVGQSAVAIYGSGTPYDTQNNTIDGLRVRRCGDYASGKVPQLNDPAIIRIVDPGSNGFAKNNTIRNIDAFNNDPSARAIIFDGIRSGTTGNVIGRFDHDFAVTDNAAGLTSLGLAGRVDLNLGTQKSRIVGDGNVTIGLFDRDVVLGATLTAPWTATLPRAFHVPPGERITVRDPKGCASSANTLTFQVAPGSGDAIRPGAISFAAPYGCAILASDGVSAWQRIA